jgi:hypothetical protein
MTLLKFVMFIIFLPSHSLEKIHHKIDLYMYIVFVLDTFVTVECPRPVSYAKIQQDTVVYKMSGALEYCREMCMTSLLSPFTPMLKTAIH